MKRALRSRLDRHCAAMSALVAAAATGGAVQNATAAIVYFPAANINIPSTIAGVYINVVTGASAGAPIAGWDVNPYGQNNLRMYSTSGAFVLGGGTGTNVANLPPGTVIDGTSAYGNLNTCDTTGAFPFVLNSSNNLVGFRFVNESSIPAGQTQYGWMRISLAAGTTFAQPRAVVEWAYEDSGAGIAAGALPPATGACCNPNGSCVPNVSQATCTGGGGVYNGAATCAAANCPQPGACCKPDGTCTPGLVPANCAPAGGVYNGGGSLCSSCPPAGACCQGDGTCTQVTQAACAAVGSWSAGACPASCDGACCMPDGTCTSNQSWTACAAAGGIYKGAGVACGGCAPQLYFDDGTQEDSIGYNSAGSTTWVLKLVSAPAKDRMTHVRVVFGTAASLNGKTATVQLYPDNGPTPGNPSGATGVLSTITAPIVGATAAGVDTTPLWTDFDIPDVTIAAGTTFYAAVTVPNVVGGDFPAGADQSNFAAGRCWISFGNTGTVPACTAPGGCTSLPTQTDITSVPLNYTWMVRVDTADSTTVSNCYANCDSSTQVPFLNVQDFTCFLGKYSAGNAYANCDNSTQAPVLNVQDFTCFLQKFSAGCSAP